MDESRFMVYVSCMTYNHSLYIKETLDGFCMQQTNFPYVCCVIDDASTDGEQEIIKRYLEDNFMFDGPIAPKQEETDDYQSVFVQHKSNKNCFFVAFYLKYNHKQIRKTKLNYIAKWKSLAKYNATCEGDDYWIDPLKLQKQVDFMESHLEHSLCFCAHRELFPSGEKKDVKRYEHNMEVCPINDLILGGGGFMATNSMFYRISMYIPYSTWAKNCPIGDGPLMLTLAHTGLVGYISDVMCVYRKSAVGSWTAMMDKSLKSRRNHHRAIIKMWRQFDEWSDRKYHDIVLKKINFNRREMLKDIIMTRFPILFKNRRNK